jgi:putative endonuclease
MSGNIRKEFCVYILASKTKGTLYIGVTSALVKRVWEHKRKAAGGFAARYGVDRLVYYELHDSAEAAIRREKQLKKWNRAWKIRLIEKQNPTWLDLYEDACA